MSSQAFFFGLTIVILIVMAAVALRGYIKKCEQRRKEGEKLAFEYWLSQGVFWLVLPIPFLYGILSILLGLGMLTR